MRALDLGHGQQLRVPDAWTVFAFNGRLYRVEGDRLLVFTTRKRWVPVQALRAA